jgi:hypothetical protein
MEKSCRSAGNVPASHPYGELMAFQALAAWSGPEPGDSAGHARLPGPGHTRPSEPRRGKSTRDGPPTPRSGQLPGFGWRTYVSAKKTLSWAPAKNWRGGYETPCLPKSPTLVRQTVPDREIFPNPTGATNGRPETVTKFFPDSPSFAQRFSHLQGA